jgi:hypothetical protein
LQKAELSREADSENDLGGSSETICITSEPPIEAEDSTPAAETQPVEVAA